MRILPTAFSHRLIVLVQTQKINQHEIHFGFHRFLRLGRKFPIKYMNNLQSLFTKKTKHWIGIIDFIPFYRLFRVPSLNPMQSQSQNHHQSLWLIQVYLFFILILLGLTFNNFSLFVNRCCSFKVVWANLLQNNQG